jgi:hypothetical protein
LLVPLRQSNTGSRRRLIAVDHGHHYVVFTADPISALVGHVSNAFDFALWQGRRVQGRQERSWAYRRLVNGLTLPSEGERASLATVPYDAYAQRAGEPMTVKEMEAARRTLGGLLFW